MNMDFDDEPTEIVTATPAAALDASKSTSTSLAKPTVESIENAIFEQHAAVVRDAGHFRDISPGDEYPPKAWVDELGEEEAYKRFRVAQSAWLPAKSAPIGLTLSLKTTVGIAKARAQASQGPRELNMQVVFYHGPMAQYPTKKVEGR